MRMPTVWLVVAVLACGTPHNPGAIDDRGAPAAIARAIPLMQSSMEEWIARKPCMSCHHQGLGLIALGVARAHGQAIDERRWAAQVTAVHDDLDGLVESFVTSAGTINGQVGVSYLDVALASTGAPRGRWSDLGAHFVAGKQAADGRWPSESHRPPLEDSEFSATAWSIRVLGELAPPSRAVELRARIERGVAWLAKATPRDTEDRVHQLLGLLWGGAAPALRAPLADVLRAEQRADGGWAQLPTRESDAYATGQVLAALHVAGDLPIADPAYQRGVAFLLRSQQPDGSWHVVSRRKGPGLPYFETGFPHGEDQFISFAATAWAVIALGQLDGDQHASVLLHGPAAQRPDRTFDLVDVTAFGSLDQLRVALDGGIDVTAAPVKLAALAATFDADRLRLFLDHGMPVSTALTDGPPLLGVAAGYSRASAAVGLLLSRGADPNLRGEGQDSPLERAAARGDREPIRQLLDAGAQLGMAFGLAADIADRDEMLLLLEHGAQPHGPDFEERPVLQWAVIDRNLPVAKLLLERGALVDERDAQGRTALHWAATVDAGTTAFVELLLHAGADPNARTPAGETPHALAVANGNRHVLRLLP